MKAIDPLDFTDQVSAHYRRFHNTEIPSTEWHMIHRRHALGWSALKIALNLPTPPTLRQEARKAS